MTRYVQVSSKGQFVLPAELRERYDIEPGTRVAVEDVGDGILLQPITRKFIRSVRGITRGAGALREKEHKRDRY